MDTQPEQLKVAILNTFQVNGAIPVTADNLKVMFDDFKSEIRSSFNQSVSGQAIVTASTRTTFQWNGRQHPVPEGYQFPSMHVAQLWDMWFVGGCYGPLRELKSHDLNCKNNVTRLSKARYIIEYMVDQLTEEEKALVRRNCPPFTAVCYMPDANSYKR